MFRTVPRSIISSFSLYTQQWYMSVGFIIRNKSKFALSSIQVLLVSSHCRAVTTGETCVSEQGVVLSKI